MTSDLHFPFWMVSSHLSNFYFLTCRIVYLTLITNVGVYLTKIPDNLFQYMYMYKA